MAIDLRTGATQLVKWGSEPALATRVSIPNVNLLSTKGSILYGTGNYATGEASINGETYQYAEVKALEAPSGTEQFILSNNSDGNLRYVPVINDYTDYGSRLGVLSASVANDINQKLHIANAAKGTGISMGDRASGINAGAIAIGNDANATAAFGEDGSFAIAIGSNAKADNKNIAIGFKAIASSYASPTIQLGRGENRTPNSFQVWNTPILVNEKIPLSSLSPTITVNEQTGLVLSNGQSGNTMSYNGTVVLGPQAVGTAANAIAIGAYARAGENAIMIGGTDLESSVAASNSVSIGCGTAAGVGGIAIGFATQAKQYGIAIGNQTSANDGVVQLGNSDAEMSLQIGKYPLMNKNGYIIANRITPYYRHCIGLKANVPGAGSTTQSFFIYFEIINKDGRKYTQLSDIAKTTIRCLCSGVGGAGSYALRLIDITGSDNVLQAQLQLSALSSTTRSIIIDTAFQNITDVEFTDTVTTIE